MSTPPYSTHNDAASALMALAGNADSGSVNENTTQANQGVEVGRVSTPPTPPTPPKANAATNRFPAKVRTYFKSMLIMC